MSGSPQTVDLTPAVVNILLHRADGWVIPCQFKPGGVATSIAGYTITAQIRDTHDATSSTSLVVTITDAPTGKFTIAQPAAGVDGFYDIQMTPPAGVPRTYVKGKISVSKDVTRP